MKKMFTSQLNYSTCSMYCPSFRSTAVRQVNISFIAFSSISCIMANTFWQMASFSPASDAGWSWYNFDFKNPHSQKSQGVRLGDLRGHA